MFYVNIIKQAREKILSGEFAGWKEEVLAKVSLNRKITKEA